MFEVDINTDQRLKVTVSPKRPNGKPAEIQGDATFSVDNTDAKVERIDANSAYIYTPDEPDDGPGFVGDITVTASGDADLGDGVETISDVVILHVSHPKATSLGLTADKPEPKPTPA